MLWSSLSAKLRFQRDIRRMGLRHRLSVRLPAGPSVRQSASPMGLSYGKQRKSWTKVTGYADIETNVGGRAAVE